MDTPWRERQLPRNQRKARKATRNITHMLLKLSRKLEVMMRVNLTPKVI
uniref:Uncharacterized protein n=1 Tax=Anguilla anguilla TaxID=7936 RepID=A0A0E9SLY3_ANGAN